MVSKKNIVLKNGANVILEFYKLPECFSIYAIDEKNDVVGLLNFEIMRQFVCERSEEECKELSSLLGIPLPMIERKEVIDVMQSNQDNFEIHDDVLIINNQKYNLKHSVAFLNLIEIEDRNFFQVGLGSAMHKLMEKYARANGCDEIRIALYYPFGEFQSGTRAFYEHSGYVFDKEKGRVYKPLFYKDKSAKGTPILYVTENSAYPEMKMRNSSGGTPIKEKYFKEK